MSATILGIGLATPPDTLLQSDARTFAQAMFGDAIEDLDRLLPIFHNTQIQQRSISQPLEWYSKPHSFREANAIYEELGASLALEAAREALERGSVDADEIGAVVFVSSTGVATPSLDVGLIQSLGISPQVRRLPIWGLGCAGGVSGLARAAELCQSQPDKAVLLVALELCSLTFQQGDLSKANLVAVSLFGDGAAALVLRAKAGDGPTVYGAHSTLFPKTEYVMGWDLVDGGFKVRFDRSIPKLVLEHLRGLLSEACGCWGLEPHQLAHYVVHPGGARVLDAYAQSLEIDPQLMRHAHQILGQYGNMSSPTVFFVLRAFLDDPHTQPADAPGVMLAWGPGFSAEQLYFRW